MQKLGYARVSTKEQNETRQIKALLDYGIEEHNIFVDKISGCNFDRPKYKKLVYGTLQKGDLLVVKSIDRLGRNYNEIIDEWRYITKELGSDIKILDMPLLDTMLNNDLIGTLISDIVLQLLSFVAENERETIRQRQAEGIAIAKEKGKHLGRPQKPLPNEFHTVYKKWQNKEILIDEACKRLNINKNRFYKLGKRYSVKVK